ncbi:hypothetical protein J2T13_003601 [Paenibacillus sp. DS2015]
MNDIGLIILILLYYGFAIWVVRDISKRNLGPAANLIVFIFVFFVPLFGVLVYLYFRSSSTPNQFRR